MPEINPILQKERARRSMLFTMFSLVLFLVTSLLTFFWMVVYGISLYVAIPFVLVSSSLGLLATTFLVTQFFGLYLCLRPIE
ncbi:MAG: hypothetical protein J6P29_04670, partial [Acetobacter sp.]|nr:hypothetical protein [Acetobacter sp.]